jgi:hypothetical protein
MNGMPASFGRWATLTAPTTPAITCPHMARTCDVLATTRSRSIWVDMKSLRRKHSAAPPAEAHNGTPRGATREVVPLRRPQPPKFAARQQARELPPPCRPRLPWRPPRRSGTEASGRTPEPSAPAVPLQAQQSVRVYLHASIDGRSMGFPASIDHARRTNWACVQASGVAERVPLPEVSPGGGWSSHTCSGSIRPSLAVFAMARRRGRAFPPAISSYSPRSPARSGHRRPRVWPWGCRRTGPSRGRPAARRSRRR